MNFSPCCGASVMIENKTVLVCTKCGKKHYMNPKGAVCMFLKDSDGKLLLARRAEEPSKGKLDCIGGFLDWGENFEEALERELEEETGLQLSDISTPVYVGSLFVEYPWPGGIIPVVGSCYVAQLKLGAVPKAMDDVASIERHDSKDIKPSDFGWVGMYEFIQEKVI